MCVMLIIYPVTSVHIYTRQHPVSDVHIGWTSLLSLYHNLILGADILVAREGEIRLVNGASANEGRVEVFLFGQWGTVCDYAWDHADATVVCHEVGYLRAVEAPRSAAFGAGSGPSWYYSLDCTGTERNLTECNSYIYNFGSACSHSRDAGVVCSGQSYSYFAFIAYTPLNIVV